MWIIFGLVVGVVLLGLVPWLRGRDIKVIWYEWLIGIVGLLLLILTIQSFFGSLAELESTAASLILLVMGLPALILLTLVWQLVWRHNHATS